MRSASPVGKWSPVAGSWVQGRDKGLPKKAARSEIDRQKIFLSWLGPTRANSEQLRSLLEGNMPVNEEVKGVSGSARTKAGRGLQKGYCMKEVSCDKVPRLAARVGEVLQWPSNQGIGSAGMGGMGGEEVGGGEREWGIGGTRADLFMPGEEER